MAATKYQLLYRYINEATNTAITNNMNNDYVKTEEIYTIDHKIEATDTLTQAEAEDEKEEMISYGNSTDNPKNDMIFAYDGTKKIRHTKWVPEVEGCYVVRDWKAIDRNLIGNRGDYSKDFITVNGESPEVGGTVVCKNLTINNKYFPSTITVVSDNSLADKGTTTNPYYSEAKINNLITNATIFALNTTGYEDHTNPSKSGNLMIGHDSIGRPVYGSTVYTGPVAIGKNDMTDNVTPYSTIYGSLSNDGLYSSITIKSSQIQTYNVPGHYEETTEYPYVIKDTYRRIQMSPWFVHATYSSLESALERAKLLVDMIGLENVKLIKLVPFDQFVKIQ